MDNAEVSTDDQTPGSTAPLASPKPATVAQCHQVIDLLAQQVTVLQEQVTLLEERVKLDSSNSSKPPSSDGPAGGNRAQRRASLRKRGAQKGHPGTFRALLAETEVNGVQDCQPAPLCECGGEVVAQGKALRHQVFDIPPAVVDVQEYRLHSGVCRGCGKPHRAVLPPGVPTGQIGPRALALIGVLGTRYHLTQLKVRDLLAQTLALDFSVGAISQAHGKVAAAMKAPVAEMARSLETAPVVHMDETSYPRERTAAAVVAAAVAAVATASEASPPKGPRLNWVWAAVQPQMAVFSILPSRARYVVQDIIGAVPHGVVVSDRYAAYAYIDSAKRQVCWAHLIRDFNRIAQRSGAAKAVGRRLLGLGYLMFRWRGAGKTSAEAFEPLVRRLRQALQRGVEQTQCRRTANTCANVLKVWPALWGFLHHPGVEPTNNAAEQALRGIVLKRKISGPTRSRRGDEFIARGFSVHETCRRQGVEMWDYLHQAVLAWINRTVHPSLVPAAAPSG